MMLMKSRKNKIITLIIFLLFSASSVSAEVLPFYKTSKSLKRGVTGSEVVALQEYLAGSGIYPADLVTGYYGKITELSVKVFQLKNGIEPAGVVGPKTKKKIAELIEVATASVPVELPPPLLMATSSSVGDVLDDVVASTTLAQFSLAPKPEYDLKSLAKEIQELVSSVRGQYGLNPIYWDDELAAIALEHSQDQANDNGRLTDSRFACHYPIIRHEGLTQAGYSLKERYESRNISYHYGGENIAMLPVSKNLLYIQPISEPITVCQEMEKFEVSRGGETAEERISLYKSILEKSLVAMDTLKPVEWINREWRSNRELAELTVEGWMNSPGHRANMLRREYALGGIGIVMVNDYIIVTHNFLGKW